ncbi:M-phase phosphoprotein 9 isoform X2 [Callorhinchus milii]|uniref:M-phase phosphoprotein 9 isoform X2 n=1 Tax=Callorhinchus milii TaxID=7868 RepID=UPI0004575E03|nr:M-phase phosphoprotein 9 isoform X2 [Callorhinchus milii]|eukprot:gi/632978606/ref/XP_007906007.1/ PREDICTED: M-phase phosphoprotein 9 isoform X2 [Callorhinchus milii]
MGDSDSESVRTAKELSNNSPKSAAHKKVEYNSTGQRTDNAPFASRSCSPLHANLRKNLLSINPSSLETLTALMQEIQNTSGAEPEVLKNCEARWLQLFKLVEKQYQEQILSQQDQYQCQIQLIQDEIKALVQLQNDSGSARCTARSSGFSKSANDSPASGAVNGHRSRCLECERESNHCEAEKWLLAAGPCRHEGKELTNHTLTSGYGTVSFSTDSSFQPGVADQNRLIAENNKLTVNERDSIQHNPFSFSSANENSSGSFMLFHEDEPPFTFKPRNASIQQLKANDERKTKSTSESAANAENLPAEQNRTVSLTSWAQKVKQKNRKAESLTGCLADKMQPQGSIQLPESVMPQDVHPASVSSSQCSFYLSRPSSSPNSLVSNVSGLTYWRLDEGELYRSLPKNKKSDLADLFSPSKGIKDDQSRTDSRWQAPSLKEIYQTRQKDVKGIPGRQSVSPRPHQSSPEVLTLDPTLHMKPSAGFPPHCHFNPQMAVSELGSRTSVSPDSMMETASQNHFDPNSDLCVDGTASPYSSSSSKFSQQKSPSPLQSWKLHLTSQPLSDNSQRAVSLKQVSKASSSLEQGEESSSTLTPPSVSCIGQSGICNNHSGSLEHSASVSSLEDPIALSICEQLERALTEAGSHIRALENKNHLMEMQLGDWPGRYDAVSTAAQALQQRLEEMRKGNKEKDNTINKLNARLKDLEQAFQKAYKHSDNKEARMKQEHKMLQDLLVEYESLGKEHERVKETLNITEDKLFDANSQISDLKRVVSKLEAQIRQVDHERNYMKGRSGADGCSRTSSNSVFHHPEAHHSPPQTPAENMVARRKWLTPGSDYSFFTGQPLESSSEAGNKLEESHLHPRRYHSPPEKDPPCSGQSLSNDKDEQLTPILRALRKMDARKAENRGIQALVNETPEGGDGTASLNRKQTVGFVDYPYSRGQTAGSYKERTRSKNSSSPPGQRSSSLPPSSRKSTPTSTPTKRNTLLTPLSAKSSPKRCPKENLSPGLNHLLGKEENTQTRFDVNLNDVETSSPVPSRNSSPRKRLQFCPLENTEGSQNSRFHADDGFQPDSRSESILHAVKLGVVTSRADWEDRTTTLLQPEKPSFVLQTPYATELTYKAQLETLGETEKLFDELTQEKQQIESALSRMPGYGGRMTLQARLEKEALENRLEKINRDLGSIRMTLKRFHILRTSANL